MLGALDVDKEGCGEESSAVRFREGEEKDMLVRLGRLHDVWQTAYGA